MATWRELAHFLFLCLFFKGQSQRTRQAQAWGLSCDLVKRQNPLGPGVRAVTALLGAFPWPWVCWSREQLPAACAAAVSCAVGGASPLAHKPAAVAAVAPPHLLPNSFPRGVGKRKSQEVARPHTSNMFGRNPILTDVLTLWQHCGSGISRNRLIFTSWARRLLPTRGAASLRQGC